MTRVHGQRQAVTNYGRRSHEWFCVVRRLELGLLLSQLDSGCDDCEKK